MFVSQNQASYFRTIDLWRKVAVDCCRQLVQEPEMHTSRSNVGRTTLQIGLLLVIESAPPLEEEKQLECGPMPNLMVDLPNIGGALCSTPQSLADAHY